MILYQHTGGVVRAVELTSNVDDLDVRHFDNSADAALVSGGVWRLCDGEGARGHCTDLSPGEYASLGALNGKVRSAYLIASVPDHLPMVAAAPAGRAVLYEFPNFGGARAVVEYGRARTLTGRVSRIPQHRFVSNRDRGSYAPTSATRATARSSIQATILC